MNRAAAGGQAPGTGPVPSAGAPARATRSAARSAALARAARTAAPAAGPASARELFRKVAAGVSVVTTRGADGRPLGLTASAVTTLSLEPALLLACVSVNSTTLPAIRAHRAFAVHLLHADQSTLAEVFAGHTGKSGAARFAGVPFRWKQGVPVLTRALGWAVCTLRDEQRYGDHSVLVGDLTLHTQNEGEPLIWHDRRFRTLTAREPQDALVDS
ncbi:flavin reductase family protein [Streptomyces sp. NBC_01007]|nr:flavin reductase family protein [Streptomyces sp. NBC_01007]WRZ95722.1 flavin reductase family protein [Streptomyces sp. NBC_01007]